MTLSLRALALAMSLLLSACAGLPEPTVAPTDWREQRARIDAIDHFTAQGKVALRTAEQAETASLVWQQAGESSHLRLSGPMGVSATTVTSNGSEVVIRQGDTTQRWDIDDPALQPTPGWDLPLGALQHWLKGVPDPGLGVDKLELDAAGVLPKTLQQQGWRIDYQAFAQFEGFTLPTRLQVVREATRARILLRQWQDISAP